MKNIIICLATTAIFFAACTSNTNKSSEDIKNDSTNELASSENNGDKIEGSVKEITTHYLHIKNALANDNGNEAANGGKAFVAAMAKLDKSLLSPDQKQVYADIEADAIEMADHISTNANKIDHQREHFEMLSNDMYDLVKKFESGQTLYLTNCPMFNNNKGANWLSETKEIKNPYLGKKMSTCGSVKEEIK